MAKHVASTPPKADTGQKLGDAARIHFAAQCSLGRQVLHARHDGHHPQSRPQRQDRTEGSRRKLRQPALRLRLLPPLHPDVRRRRARRFQTRLRRICSTLSRKRRRPSSIPTSPPKTCKKSVEIFKKIVRKAIDQEGLSRRTLWFSSRWPATRSSGPGTTPRANHYRRMNDISHTIGTAVNVQTMVFGNLGESSGTGVGFTRNPATGENHVLRRVPDQRPGRGRRRRHSHAASDRRA